MSGQQKEEGIASDIAKLLAVPTEEAEHGSLRIGEP